MLKINSRIVVKAAFLGIVCIILSASFTVYDKTKICIKLDENAVAGITKITAELDTLSLLFSAPVQDKAACKKHYEAARVYYKQVQYFIEYHFPFHSKYFINGPLVNKAEAEYGYKTFAPHGFQVLENSIYSPAADTSADAKYEIALLKKSFDYVKEQSRNKQFKNSTAIDMMRFEIIRIMSLYLNGYDCTINRQNTTETKSILDGLTAAIQLFPAGDDKKAGSFKIIANGKKYLSENSDYDTFNRLYFFRLCLKPLYGSLHDLYDENALREKTNYAVNIRQKDFYGAQWFNMSYFSVVLKDSNLVDQQATLGKLLFFDPVLSGNNKRACASCHNPDNGFGGSVDFNRCFESDEKLKRNTPSLLNAVFQKSFFGDGRSLQFEDQVSDVLNNHKEMFSNATDIVSKLRQSPEYKKMFKAAFANTEDTAITYYAVLKSISEYERKLVTLNSRFDKYVRGDEKQLSEAEIDGYNIFAGKALCGSCHFFPLFNGVPPPFYSDNEYEVIGVPKNKLNKEMDADSGRYEVSKNRIHTGAFKTAGIRNIDKTAPYMHNSAYTTLDEVIGFYQKGGGAGLGLPVNNQTLPFDSLQLSTTEIEHLKKFMLSLTDRSFHPSIPQKLPVVNIKGIEVRKVGGMY